MKDMKLPESVQKFMETFCSENREEIIYSSVIHCAGAKEIGVSLRRLPFRYGICSCIV